MNQIVNKVIKPTERTPDVSDYSGLDTAAKAHYLNEPELSSRATYSGGLF